MKKSLLQILLLMSILTGCVAQNEVNTLYTGTIEADEIIISSEVSGKIIDIKVQEGQNISIGTEIAQLDTTDLEIQLEKAQASLDIANASLEEILNGSRSEEIKNATAGLKNIEALLEGAKKNYDYRVSKYEDLVELYKNGAVSEQELKDSEALMDDSETNFKSLQQQYESAKSKLDLLLNGSSDESIKQAEANVRLAEAEIKNIKNQIDKRKIIAPHEGIIETVNFNKGEIITAGGNIANIVDLENLWVKIYIPERELHRVSLGDKVNITSNHLNKDIEGMITYISSEAEFTPKNVESKESKEELVFEVKVKLMDKDLQLKPGMLVDVELGSDN